MQASTIQIKKRLYHLYWFLAIFVAQYPKTILLLFDESQFKNLNAGPVKGQLQLLLYLGV